LSTTSYHITPFALPGVFRRLLLSLLLVAGAFGAQAQVREYQLKAVFLFNFSQFVEWPAAAFDSPSAPLIIGVEGPNPFGRYLAETVKGESIAGRPVVVRYFASKADIRPCHILFINKKDSREVISLIQGKSVLTVGDNENFTTSGGIIQFFTEQNKIRFQISPAAARAANLNISSKLLRLAKIVE